jgi:hypothetical protein
MASAAGRVRPVTPHRLFLAMVSTLAGATVDSLADLLREFIDQNGIHVAYTAFDTRLAGLGFATCRVAMGAHHVLEARVTATSAVVYTWRRGRP